jgi:hypothetical protein
VQSKVRSIPGITVAMVLKSTHCYGEEIRSVKRERVMVLKSNGYRLEICFAGAREQQLTESKSNGYGIQRATVGIKGSCPWCERKPTHAAMVKQKSNAYGVRLRNHGEHHHGASKPVTVASFTLLLHCGYPCSGPCLPVCP